MKRLLYIVDDGKRNFTYARVAGFMNAIKKAGAPINLYVIRSSGLGEYDAAHNCGEYNIYHLPDFSDFDAIILDINNFYNTNENLYGAKGASYVTRAAAASGKPVISLANKLADFYYVGIDNYAAMTSVIEYLHGELGLSDFWFLMGPEDNYENKIRSEALTAYCRDKGLPVGQERFHAESYAVESGIHGFGKLYHSHNEKLPQAIICSNDQIALGACRAAAAAGRAVPKDMMVTGFDNNAVSAYLSPTITTVDQLQWTMGEICIDIIQRIWRSDDVPLVTYTPTNLILRESTGAPKPTEENIMGRIGEFLNKEMYTEYFQNQLCAIQYKLPGCETIEEMCLALEPCIPAMQCRGLYLVLDKELYEYGNQISFDQGSGQAKSTNEGLMTEGYPESMELVFFWEEGIGMTFPKKTIQGLFPTFDSDKAGRDFLFAPIHFMDASVGYIVIRDCEEILHTGNIAPIVNTLTMAMRGFFAGKKLEYLNQMLSGISMRDSLTGLCNRLGYHHLASRLFRRVTSEGRRLGVIFLDMDKMKYFNDVFGHSCGDDAICSVSAAISANIPKDAIPVRFGGDEFMVLTPAGSREEVTELIERILNSIPAEAKARNMPDVPGISTGFVLTDPKSNLTLNDYVDEADKLMYNDKKSRKACRQ